MSWPPLQTFLVIIVTSVAANHNGANCDCASQGPWQPLFKPSQILHSEFPEHQHSSSTGGPKPTKIRHYKLVPHIVVPLVNPVALTIQHQNDNHIHEDDKYKYKTKGNYNKHKIKQVHYHYNYPDPNEPNSSKYNDLPSTPTPSEGSYLDNNYPEDDATQQNFPNEGTQDSHNQHEDTHHSQEEDGYNNYGVNPTGEGVPSHSYDTTTHDQHYSHEEQPTYNPYYGSGEQNDAVYDASKLSPGYEVRPSEYPVYKPVPKENDKHYTNYHSNSIGVRGKSRGKSIFIPIYRINQPSNMIKNSDNSVSPYQVQEASTEKPMPVILPTNPTLFSSNHHNFMNDHLHHHHQPLPLVHPPFSFYNPWRLLMKDEARRIILMRPPAPGLPDTWTTMQNSLDGSTKISPSKVKMTGVIYPFKNVPIK